MGFVYYHYVAFNKIAGVLDEEAGKVFRFKEQEQLHEELIDDGIAKIYQAHLNVARTVAEDAGAVIVTELVAGKPYQAIRKYIEKHNASLLVIGKTGVHADDHLGGIQVKCSPGTEHIPESVVIACAVHQDLHQIKTAVASAADAEMELVAAQGLQARV